VAEAPETMVFADEDSLLSDSGSSASGMYLLGPVLGQGGFGTVHRATHLLSGEEVAVKIIKAASAAIRKRAQREIGILHTVQHERLVGIRDAFDMGADIWIIMNLVEGKPFPGPVRRDWRELRPLFLSLLDGLDAMHRHGVIHRDLKPSNVLVSSEGPTILDFGVSWYTEADALTRTMEVVGTLRYASRRQLLSETPQPSWDLYSACVMLVEALLGKVYMVKERDKALAELAPMVGDDVCSVLEGVLSERPTAPSTAAELRDRLDGSGTADIRRLVAYPGHRDLWSAYREAVKDGTTLRVDVAPGVRPRWFWWEVAKKLGPRAVRADGSEELQGLVHRANGDLASLEAKVAEWLGRRVLLAPYPGRLTPAVRAFVLAASKVRAVVAASPGEPLRPFTRDELAEIFVKNRLLRVHEIASDVLHRSTGGQPEEVLRALERWLADGTAKRHGRRLLVNYDGASRLNTQLMRPAAPPVKPVESADEQQMLLDMLQAAPDGATVAELAEAWEKPAWHVQALLMQGERHRTVERYNLRWRCVYGGDGARLGRQLRDRLYLSLASGEGDFSVRFSSLMRLGQREAAVRLAVDEEGLEPEVRFEALKLSGFGPGKRFGRRVDAALAIAACESQGLDHLRDAVGLLSERSSETASAELVSIASSIATGPVQQAYKRFANGLLGRPDIPSGLSPMIRRFAWQFTLLGAPRSPMAVIFPDVAPSDWSWIDAAATFYRANRVDEFASHTSDWGASAVPWDLVPSWATLVLLARLIVSDDPGFIDSSVPIGLKLPSRAWRLVHDRVRRYCDRLLSNMAPQDPSGWMLERMKGPFRPKFATIIASYFATSARVSFPYGVAQLPSDSRGEAMNVALSQLSTSRRSRLEPFAYYWARR